jgi:hypothetical protein
MYPDWLDPTREDSPVTRTTPSPVKPGCLSTEFWGKLIVQAVVLLNSRFDVAIDMDMQTAVTIVAGLEALYMVIRGHVKASSYKTLEK